MHPPMMVTVVILTFLKSARDPMVPGPFHLPKQVVYFSDPAGQYKNRQNFANLSLHKEDHQTQAEWHFFATSHGKGPCDGVGGTLKRLASRASLQRTTQDQIQTPLQLSEWAKSNLPGITTVFCSKQDIAKHEEKLKDRFDSSITIAGTQKLHAFYPAEEPEKLIVKRFSNSTASSRVRVLRK